MRLLPFGLVDQSLVFILYASSMRVIIPCPVPVSPSNQCESTQESITIRSHNHAGDATAF